MSKSTDPAIHYSSLITHYSLLYPISNKNICIMTASVVAVAAPHNFFSIGREHGKCIKLIAVRDLFKTAAIAIDHVEIKWKTSFVLMIGCKNDPLAIGKKCRRPIGLAIVGHLPRMTAIGIGNKNFHV